jgi:type VI protein secretion system component VasF
MNKNQNVINSWRVAELPFQLVDWMQAFHQELLEDGLSTKSIKSYLRY